MIVRVRVHFIALLIGVVFIALVGRLFYIQVINGNEYAMQSRRQTRQRAILPAARGRILDVKGRILAKNVQSKLQTSQEIAAFVISSADSSTPKVGQQTIERVYPYGELAGSVLGYVGRDGNGLGGIEFAYDEHLCGENGWTILQRDGRNFRYRRIGLPTKRPETGADIFLTIDVEVQEIVENVLAQTVRHLDAKGGMCIITEPKTGRIIAMANYPRFNPNIAGHYPIAQRKNKCIEYNYEPGSTFKILTAASALQANLLDENDKLDGGNGVYQVYDQVIRDRRAFGSLTFTEALTVSSNVCFAKVAERLGDDRLYRYAKEFGMGARCGIELPGEEGGTLSPVSQWSGRTGPTVAIGQEISVTLLQMMTSIGCVANDGVLLVPTVCDRVVGADGKTIATSQRRPVRQVLSADVARRMRAMLGHVVAEGTGNRAAIDGIPIGGKTGTSQKYDSEQGTYSLDKYWSSFIGFIPQQEPVLLCGIVIDEPGNGESGGVAAAPAFRKIMSQIISNPRLEYGERILLQCRNRLERRENQSGPKPDVITAGVSLPLKGGSLSGKKSTGKAGALKKLSKYQSENVTVPDLRNSDAREAVRFLSAQGLLPFLEGKGRVQSQHPKPGQVVSWAQPCTLYCSTEF